MASSYNQAIITMLFEHQKKAEDDKEPFKVRAYKNAIRNIKDLGYPILSINDIDGIDGVGKKIREKIQKLINETPLTNLRHEKPTIDKVYGIGPAAIKAFNSKGIYYIEQLQDNMLNDKQKIGLKYWNDLDKRISYEEMELHSKYITRRLRGYTLSIVGSFRRGKESSGDIDVLVIGNNDSLQDVIHKLGDYVVETLASKTKKFMGICRLDNNPARRLDILITTPEEFPYAQLYFTGSKEHNVKMRSKAKQMGYRLNEHGMTKIHDSASPIPIMHNEQDIFRFLDIEYLEPKNR
eukprot:768657-Hanusia_phi.AAC.11